LADQLGLKGTRRGRSGRLILGDVLLALNGVPLRNGEDLIAALEGHVPGDQLTLRFKRDERTLETRFTLPAP
ncbi:PDZ domain-containing protein, partial [Myxococcota bacterium]|nr:PDZ domain-containing protein [Myxococcota bacterium]